MKYVALLRGIGPMNPNMKNDKLCSFFESLGYQKVRAVLSTGNILFESDSGDIPALEAEIEEALPQQLGFSSRTIIRSVEQLQALIDQNPFGEMSHGRNTYLNVTFLKYPEQTKLTFPYRVESLSCDFVGMYAGGICSVTDVNTASGSDLMRWIEKQFGKDNTTRTWKTVGKILAKLNES